MELFQIYSVLILLCILPSIKCQRERINVTLPDMGTLSGITGESSVTGRQFYAFRGIPFGKPPVGSLRYQAPEMVDGWEGVLDASWFGNRCVQSCPGKSNSSMYRFWKHLHDYLGDEDMFSEYYQDKEDSEDCLFTHVYTPTVNPSAKLPVMVFYHGGSFEYGSAMPYLPNYFMEHDVVLVVPHYRLGAVGLISMQNDEIPGNAAMLDQVLALEWVNQFIEYFGGDPELVTAFGESAGAASVSLLALTPLTREPKKLISKIIAESGAALAEWAIDREPVYNARGIASYAGCDMTSDKTITQCFLDADVCVLLEAQDKWSNVERTKGKSGFGGCSPVIQTTGSKIFMDRDPALYWEDPNFEVVPSIYGSNKHEGTYVLGIVYDDYMGPNDLVDDAYFLKYDMIRPFFIMFGISDNANVVTDAIEYEYVGIDRMGNFTAMSPGLVDFSGATFLKAPGYESTVKHSKHSTENCYQYSYNYMGRTTAIICSGVVGGDFPFPAGVCHAAEVPMLFGFKLIQRLMTDFERQLSAQMVQMWFNFAKYGNPTPPQNPVPGVPDWPPYDEETEYYLRIDREYLVLQDFKKNEYTIAKEEDFFKN